MPERHMFWKRAVRYGSVGLLGGVLTGAIWGWVVIRTVRTHDAALRATALAKGVAEAVNCSAFVALLGVVLAVCVAWVTARRASKTDRVRPPD